MDVGIDEQMTQVNTVVRQPHKRWPTHADASGRATMNLVTYASPVALQPPVYALGLYKGTQSWANWRATRRGLLQAGAVGVSCGKHRAGSACHENCGVRQDCEHQPRVPSSCAHIPAPRKTSADQQCLGNARFEVIFYADALQILRRQHAELVQLLGKTSARDVDKLAQLADRGFETFQRLGYSSIAGAFACTSGILGACLACSTMRSCRWYASQAPHWAHLRLQRHDACIYFLPLQTVPG